MDKLAIAQQIKIIKDAALTIPVYRAPTEDYDSDRPSKFDKHVHMEKIQVNAVLNHLLRTVTYLSKELMLRDGNIPAEVWKNLAQVRDLVRDQKHTQSATRR
tara:strand:+ start:999 stop:1304 length:306 start_codon:yes stop_codon:yes gene_type:complete